jgi:hypothetical protein
MAHGALSCLPIVMYTKRNQIEELIKIGPKEIDSTFPGFFGYFTSKNCNKLQICITKICDVQ